MTNAIPSRSTAGPGPSYPPLSHAGYVIGVLFIVTLSSQLDRQLPALLVGPLRAEFGLSDTAFSLLHGYGFVLSFALGGLVLGRWVDHGNRRNLLVGGLLFWSLSTALFALSDSYGTLLLARVGVGLGEAVLAPAAYSLIADLIPPQRQGRALAAYCVSIAVGSGASLLLGGWLLAVIPAGGLALPGGDHLPAWRVTFLAAGAIGAPLALLLAGTVGEPARQHGPSAGPRGADRSSGADFFGYVRRHSAASVRVLGFPILLAVLGYGALTWAPALFERNHGIPPAKSGIVLGILVAIAGGIGTLAGGFLSDFWLHRGVPAARLRVALVGVGISAVPAVLWPLVPSPVLAYGLEFLSVLGIGLALSAAPAAVLAVFPNQLRGRAIAAYTVLSALLGIGLGPTAVALVTDHVFQNDHAVGWAIALTAAPAVLFGLWLLITGLEPYSRMQAALQRESDGESA